MKYTNEQLASLEKGASQLAEKAQELDDKRIKGDEESWIKYLKAEAARFHGYTENGMDICCVAEIAQTWRGSQPTVTFRYKFHRLKEIGKPETKGRAIARAKLLESEVA